MKLYSLGVLVMSLYMMIASATLAQPNHTDTDFVNSPEDACCKRKSLGKSKQNLYILQDFYLNGQKRTEPFHAKNFIQASQEEPYDNYHQSGVVGKLTIIHGKAQQTEVRHYNKNSKLEGIWEAKDSDGILLYQYRFINGVANGAWTDWYDRKQKSREGTYKSGKEEGIWTYWYDNGNIREQVAYKNGLENGLWMSYHQNGQKQREGVYQNSIMTGVWRSWYENGQLESKSNFKNGFKQGVFTEWYANGQKRSERIYKNGKIDGLMTSWMPDGAKNQGVFTNGKKNGVWHHWDCNGVLYKTEHYKNGVLMTKEKKK